MKASAESFAALERELASRTAELDACKAELGARNADREDARIAREYQDASNEVLRIIGESPGDVQQVLDAIVERAVKLSGASRGTVSRFDGEKLYLAAVFGRSVEELADERALSLFPMRPGRASVHARAVLEQAPAQCADVQTDPDYAPEGRVVAESQGFRSALAVPMLRDGQVIGSIGVSRPEPGLFPDQLIKLLRTFAEQAVIAIENARLIDETREALEHQTATSEILKVISSSPTDVQPVFEKILDSCQVLFGAEQMALTVVDEDRQVHIGAQRGAEMETLSQVFPKPVDETFTGLVISERRTLHIPDAAEAGDELPDTWRTAYERIGNFSGVVAPLLRGTEGIGSIGLIRVPPKPFSYNELALLTTFADQAVIAIENVRLFNETKEALEQQTATAEILQVISSSPTDVQPVMEAIAERATTLCNARLGAVTSFDGNLVHMKAVYGASPDEEAAIWAIHPVEPGRTTYCARAIQERRTINIADLRDDSEHTFGGDQQVITERSALTVPMLRDGQPIGAISVAREIPGVFPESLVTLLQTFAEQAVIAIENVRLFNETQEALERQTATAEILQVISNSPTDVQPVFEAIAQRAKSICGARFAITTQLNGEQVELMAMSEMPAEDIENMRSAFPMSLDTAAVNCRAIAAKAPVQIADITTDPKYLQQFSENLMNVSSRARLAVPMIRDGKAFGSIGVARDEPGEFPDKLVKLLQTFAAQAVIAVENVRLFNETKEALERQTAMSEVLRVISESPTDVQPVFDAIVERAMALCGATKGSGTRFDGEQLHMMSFQGVSDEDAGNAWDMFPSPPGTGTLNGRAVLACAPAQITDWNSDPDVATEWQGISSGLAVPLVREGRAVGSLAVFREESGPFPDQQVNLLQTFADQAVIATENVRLFNETQEALERQTATADILKVISSSPTDVQPVYEKILDSCKALFGVADMSIGLVHEDGRIYDAASRGELMQAVLKVGRSTPLEGSATEHVIGKREIFHLPELGRDTDPPWPFVRVLSDAVGPCSLLMAPLLHRDQGIGSISLLRQPPKAFSDKEIALLGTFADQAVIAIENVRLFNETKESLDQQTAISDILRVTTESPTDVQPVLDAIGDHASGLCDAASASIYLIESDHLRHVTSRGPLAEQTLSVDLIPIDRTSTMGRAIVERRTVNIEDMQAEAEEFPRSYEIAQRLDYRSIVAAPLFREGKPFGAILLLRQDVRPFSDREAGLLRTFGDQAAIALENVRLFHEIEGKSRELEAANEHKSEFLANMSHELRTPLNAIIGFSEVMLERMFGELNEKQDDYLKDIHSSGEHLLSLINDILDLSKIEAGRMELEVDEFDIAGALDNTLTLIRERAQQHGIALRLEADERLGAIRADQRKFKQIMLNLLSNAVKFTPDGGQIEVRAAFKDNELEVAVRDTGIGIAPEDQDAVFQEFQQAGGRFHNKQEGTGLGLSLTKRFVELHGGTIGLVSTPGEGSTFSFTLPRQAAGASPL